MAAERLWNGRRILKKNQSFRSGMTGFFIGIGLPKRGFKVGPQIFKFLPTPGWFFKGVEYRGPAVSNGCMGEAQGALGVDSLRLVVKWVNNGERFWVAFLGKRWNFENLKTTPWSGMAFFSFQNPGASEGGLKFNPIFLISYNPWRGFFGVNLGSPVSTMVSMGRAFGCKRCI